MKFWKNYEFQWKVDVHANRDDLMFGLIFGWIFGGLIGLIIVGSLTGDHGKSWSWQDTVTVCLWAGPFALLAIGACLVFLWKHPPVRRVDGNNTVRGRMGTK